MASRPSLTCSRSTRTARKPQGGARPWNIPSGTSAPLEGERSGSRSGTFHVFLTLGSWAAASTSCSRKSTPAAGIAQCLAHVRKSTHTCFLLITMVAAASPTWAAVCPPQATSTLIKIFVYGFATEWVFFLGEIVALLIYYYTFDRMDPADHMGWLYFLFAFLSSSHRRHHRSSRPRASSPRAISRHRVEPHLLAASWCCARVSACPSQACSVLSRPPHRR